MSGTYDVCVDYDALCKMEDNLLMIQHDLSESTERMKTAIAQSQNFLAGNQFEKAKNTTLMCAAMSETTLRNIDKAKNYLSELRMALDLYARGEYEEV